MIGAVLGSLITYVLIGAFIIYVILRANGPLTMRRFLLWLTENVLGRPRVIYDGDGIDPYLSRWHLIGGARMPDGSWPFDGCGDVKPGAIHGKLPFGLYLHRFHVSDLDRELHNHPWKWALSFILSGGYREDRRILTGIWVDSIETKAVRPFRFNWITCETFHRVELVDEDAWSLILVGPKFGGWGFWDAVTGVFTPWRPFLEKKRKARRVA